MSNLKLRRVILAAALFATIANADAAADNVADGAPVYHIAIIELINGRKYEAAMASAFACVEFTRAIAAEVAAADCLTFTGFAIVNPGAPRADYFPPRP